MATDANEIAGLRRRFRGALLRPGEQGYDVARRIWNGAIDRRPALIARCTGVDDVVEAVRFAREVDLVVSVRGGGHAVAGHAVCDGGVMIDLSLMKAVQVDHENGTARAAGGVLWGELDRATQQHGLATTGGIISHTGIAGLTLGGGLGHLMRKHGLTVDNLRAVDLVTADAQCLHVDARTDPELFWGLRGGGGNFGIATTFDYQLHPVGPIVLGGPIFWPLSDAPEVLGALATTRPTPPTSSAAPSRRGWRHLCCSCPPSDTARRSSASSSYGPATSPTARTPSNRSAGSAHPSRMSCDQRPTCSFSRCWMPALPTACTTTGSPIASPYWLTASSRCWWSAPRPSPRRSPRSADGRSAAP
jgi:hypothetical protein